MFRRVRRLPTPLLVRRRVGHDRFARHPINSRGCVSAVRPGCALEEGDGGSRHRRAMEGIEEVSTSNAMEGIDIASARSRAVASSPSARVMEMLDITASSSLSLDNRD